MKIDLFTLSENLRGFDLTFQTTYDLFSYRKIDDGTKLLIDTFEIGSGMTCLDLGCGYGPIGIVMAKLNPKGKIFFVDRDFVAVETTKTNCKINNVTNVQVQLSNGLSTLGNVRFDVIASNLPTHIAKEALQQIIIDTKEHLKPGGKLYVVSTRKLQPFIERLLNPIFSHCEVIQKRGEYVVFLTQA